MCKIINRYQVIDLDLRKHTSFLFTVKDDQKCYKVLIGNMPTIISECPFPAIPAYPDIARIWLADLAGQFNMHESINPVTHLILLPLSGL